MTKIYASWKDFPMSQWRWPDFSPQEMACRGTGRLKTLLHGDRIAVVAFLRHK